MRKVSTECWWRWEKPLVMTFLRSVAITHTTHTHTHTHTHTLDTDVFLTDTSVFLRHTWNMRLQSFHSLMLVTIIGKEFNNAECDIAEIPFITLLEVSWLGKNLTSLRTFMEGNPNANPNQLIRTSWEGIQLVSRTQVADIMTVRRGRRRKEGWVERERWGWSYFRVWQQAP